jgi:hypothetical protein
MFNPKLTSNPRRIVEGAINHPVLKKFRYILSPLSAILTPARGSLRLIFEAPRDLWFLWLQEIAASTFIP